MSESGGGEPAEDDPLERRAIQLEGCYGSCRRRGYGLDGVHSRTHTRAMTRAERLVREVRIVLPAGLHAEVRARDGFTGWNDLLERLLREWVLLPVKPRRKEIT